MNLPDHRQPGPAEPPTVTTSTHVETPVCPCCGLVHYIGDDCILATLAEIARLTKPPTRVKCSERMPTKEDQDCEGMVWWWWEDGTAKRMLWNSNFQCAVYWQSTGLHMPEPPKETGKE